LALMFLTGDAMRGGRLHHHISGALFVGEWRTAPRYRLYSINDAFPALRPVSAGGQPILGELYDVPMDQLWHLLADEPPELELWMVELGAREADTTSESTQSDVQFSFGMVLRRGERGGYLDITDYGGWRAYRERH
jgi:gamma-glutamylcyclotransferase (GGCT)/AIG2-like uncharacterized protein YtfP